MYKKTALPIGVGSFCYINYMIRSLFLIVLTPLVILSASIWYYAFDSGWYEYARSQSMHPEYASTQKANAVFTYVQTGDTTLLHDYTTRELAHLADIYQLISRARIVTLIMVITWLVVFVSSLQKQGVKKTVRKYFNNRILNFDNSTFNDSK